MKLGLGFHRSKISRDNFRFARQAGCTHAVVHLVERSAEGLPPGADEFCFGRTHAAGVVWPFDELRAIWRLAADEGLRIEALENIDPSFWSEILLDGPGKRRQLERLKELLRDMGRIGIGALGYNFSLAGVWGRVHLPVARGGAMAPSYSPGHPLEDAPLPRGFLNNIAYEDVPSPGEPIGPIAVEELWGRLTEFLEELVPVAQEAGVRLAAHPDDPPVARLRATPRLLHRPVDLDRLLEIVAAPANALEFCVGTVQEMGGCDVCALAEGYARRGAIAYVHCRNVRGTVPRYHETFIDDGDVDMRRLLRGLHRGGFDGVVIPDHAPAMTCDAPWHAGMAHALGFLKATLMDLGAGAPADLRGKKGGER